MQTLRQKPRPGPRITLGFLTIVLICGVSVVPSSPVRAQNLAASFTIQSGIQSVNPAKYGFSVSQTDGGADITDNNWVSDGGVSPYDTRQMLQATDGSTTTAIVDENVSNGNQTSEGTDIWDSVATGYFVGATSRIYRMVNNQYTLLRTDTVTGYTAVAGSTNEADHTITFASSGPAVKSGDAIFLTMDDVFNLNLNTISTRMQPNTYDTWSIVPTNGSATLTRIADGPPGDNYGLPGANTPMAIEMTTLTAQAVSISQWFEGAFFPGDEQFQSGRTYEISVWLKQSGIATPNVTVTLGQLGVSTTFTGVTGSWQQYTYTFAAVPGVPVGSVDPNFVIGYTGPGTLEVDEIELYDTSYAPYSLSSQVAAAWQNFHPSTMRFWSNYHNSSGNQSLWSLSSWLAPESKTRDTILIGSGGRCPGDLVHLPTALAYAKAAGANPWLLVNMSLNEQDWSNLIDYLAGPSSTTYGAMRPSTHPGPYTADFSTIYIEFGNEEWNAGNSGPVYSGYGQFASYMLSKATANPNYNSSQIKFILNSFTLNPAFGSGAISNCPQASYLDYFNYVGGISSLSVSNGSFETPALSSGSYTYTPAGSSWTFSTPSNGATLTSGTGAGIINITGAPSGSQVAFIQNTGSLSQSLSGFFTGSTSSTSGTWTFTVHAAQSSGANPAQGVNVLVDGASVGTITPTGTTFATYTVNFTTTAGSHTIEMLGTNASGNAIAYVDEAAVAPSENTYLQNELLGLPGADADGVSAVNSWVAQQNLDAAAGHPYGIVCYEGGPGQDIPSQSGDTTLAAGVATLDENLYCSSVGVGTQNFFLYNLGTGPYTSHTNFANGFYPHPVWEALQMRNAYTNGNMVTVQTNSDPTTNDTNAYPIVGCYAFHDTTSGNAAEIFVVSRDVANSTPVTLTLPTAPTGAATLYTLTGSASATNNASLAVPIVQSTINSFPQTYTFTMPPSSAYLFVAPTGAWPTPPAPAAPVNPKASPGYQRVALTWSASSGATSYNVLRATVSGGPYTTVSSTGFSAYLDNVLTNGVTYYYVVQAVNTGGTSPNSAQVSATPNGMSVAYATTTPVINGSAGAAWSVANSYPVTNLYNGPIPSGQTFSASYQAMYDSNNLYVLAKIVNNETLVSNSTTPWDGDDVELYIDSTDSKAGSYGPGDFQYELGWGLTAAQETKDSPASLTGVQYASAAVSGGWNAEVAIPWTTLGATPVTNNLIGIDVDICDGFNAGVTKLFWWNTNNTDWNNPSSFGSGQLMSSGSGAPGTPSGLGAVAGNAQVALSWSSSSGATSYDLYRGTASGAESTTPVATGIPGTTYTNTGLTSGTTYYFKVTAVNASGTSGYSNEASAIPESSAPSAPTGLVALPGNTQAALSWTGSAGATGYNVYRGTSAGGESSTPLATGLTATVYTDTGLTNGATYYYKVTAVNSAGTSAYSNESSATPITMIQINSGGTAVSGTNWVADTDATGSSSTSSTTSAITTTGLTNPAPQAVYQTDRYGNMTYTIPGLTVGATYTVRLHFAEIYHGGAGEREFNVTINSTQVLTNFDIFADAGGKNIGDIKQFTATPNSSGQIVIVYTTVIDEAKSSGIEVIAASGGSAPAAPTGLSATAGNSQVTLTWTASSGATCYSVYRGTTSGGESTTPIATGLTTATYTNTGLTNGTTYFYEVKAVNASGTSGYSNESSAVPAPSLTLQINSGGTAISGTSWIADTDHTGSASTSSTSSAITTSGVTNPAPQAVYQTDRYGNMTYTIPSLTVGAVYTVRLHFAEIYHGGAGEREFNVTINGTQVLTNFDIFADAGGKNIADIKQFTATANSSGQIVIVYTTVIDEAKSSGLEILH